MRCITSTLRYCKEPNTSLPNLKTSNSTHLENYSDLIDRMNLCVNCDGFAQAIAKRSQHLLLEDPTWNKTLGCPLCSLISDHLDVLGSEDIERTVFGGARLYCRSLETVIAYDHEPLSNVSVGGISFDIWSHPGKPQISVSI